MQTVQREQAAEGVDNMEKGTKLILLGGGLLALFYLPTIYALAKLKVMFAGVRLVSLKNETLSVEVNLVCDNVTNTPLTFQTGRLDMYFNNYYFGTSEVGIFRTVPAKSRGLVTIMVDVPFTNALAAAWNSLLEGRLLDYYTLTLNGKVRVNNKTIPIRGITFTANEIENALS